MLRGNALAKIDDKGRLKLPSVFRTFLESNFGREFFVTSIRGECVRVYPLKVYADLEQRLARASSMEPVVNRLRNALSYFGQTATMDSQGRVLLHPLLRQKASIDGEVSVLGQQNYLDIWNRATFEKRVVDDPLTDDELRELSSLGF